MKGSLGGCLGNATGKSKIKQKPDLNMVIDKKTQFYMTDDSKNVTVYIRLPHSKLRVLNRNWRKTKTGKKKK